ncbi:hypothetical protein [Elizabethkingia miricola]|uniref:hypothetical protein n=1 Tax=Elizabethkingia miricola TaxID=172045 RepID=UPI000B3573F3|nr:hypothetical protein [Elizabethkingia miricola]NHQ68419.1 cytochrome P460 family protein [Elizabethkingia miricola]NHQ72525.1 cytochrome P460 family protein [Elizabethkingia miricola]NHQ79506.1 cytochrome P460 family protein [Elizabethkingia miricola]PSL86745.1 hypothetical protein C7V10_19075 [Elizabethkingia miricola]QHQ85841.1 hypothetical protein FE632_03125 [Elizabethkingia miricola]
MKNLINCLILSTFIVSCSSKKEYETVNKNASLPENFDFNAMNLKVVSSSINLKKQTMITLYGNPSAINELKGIPDKDDNKERILALITWSQKDDPYWYGAKIPDHLLSVEVIKSEKSFIENSKIQYQRYEGKYLKKVNVDGTNRINKILSIKPSIMP